MSLDLKEPPLFNSLTTGLSGLFNLLDATSLVGEAILTTRGGEKALIPAKMFT